MKVRYYAIRDSKVGFMNLQAQQNDDVAARGFKNLLNSSERNIVNTNPEDYSIYFIGEFDENTGKFTPLEEPLFICNHLSFGGSSK